MNDQEPELTEQGDETHPAFGRVTLNRTSSSHGASLFDSEIRHDRFVTLRIHEATRRRDLNRDWIHPGRTIIEVEMSEAQWAAMISSFSDGGGTSCTISYTREDGPIPGIPFAPRMEHSMSEVRGAADESLAKVREAFAAVKEKPTKANIRHMEIVLDNAPKNMASAAKSLTEHAENVVQKARADIEAMVVQHAEHLGLNGADAVAALELCDIATVLVGPTLVNGVNTSR